MEQCIYETTHVTHVNKTQPSVFSSFHVTCAYFGNVDVWDEEAVTESLFTPDRRTCARDDVEAAHLQTRRLEHDHADAGRISTARRCKEKYNSTILKKTSQ